MVRTCVEAMAATQGHTQSLHTNALDEALALPTDFSARIARNTQLFLQQESGTTRIIDPWGGSYYVEKLTQELATKAWSHIQEIESSAAWRRRSKPAFPNCASRKRPPRTQARIDSGHQKIIGVNCFKSDDEASIDILQGRQRVGAQPADREAPPPARRARSRTTVDAALAALLEGAPLATATCSTSR